MTDDATEFQFGNVVRLKSGGPTMTVKGETSGALACTWFNKDGGKHETSFHPAQLEDFKPAASEVVGV